MRTGRTASGVPAKIMAILVLASMAVSCSRNGIGPEQTTVSRTVAVILPMQDGLGEHWKRTTDLYLGEFDKAQTGQNRRIDLNVEFYDEDTEDIAALISDLCDREDVDAVVGGLRSANASIMAEECSWERKTFFTLATAEELIRAHSSEGYLWAMTETDITECEVLLSRVEAYGAKSVALAAKDNDPYGKTFIDWFAFQAQEFGMEIKGIFTYTGNDAGTAAGNAVGSGADAVICIPTDIADIAPMQSAVKDSRKIVLFGDTAFGTNVLQLMGEDAEGIEGVAFISDPESGFDVMYSTYFDTYPTLGEAQYYDALLMLGYGFCYQSLHEGTSLKDALRKVVDGRESMSTGWMGDGIAAVLRKLEAGDEPDISGASGSLDFDELVYTNVLNTVYCHFKVYMGAYIYLDYLTSDGSNRTQSTLAGWNWEAESMQDFDDGNDMEYPELDQRWALLAATSDRWEDYRYQADVLAMYQLLKSSGYDDSHIVLIMEDNLAYHELNPDQGYVRVDPEGENLYHDIILDYRLSDLSKEDIQDIICGRSSERLPSVIGADEDDNVFVFWSGHGLPGIFCWGYTPDGIDGDMAMEMLSEARFRKMICFIETCYSGSVASSCTGIPGLLFFTAANEFETSKADVFSSRLNVWMTNRFTLSLRSALRENPSISLRELYYTLFRNTVGSHVMVYNNDSYGNMFNNTMQEFIGGC